jgi:hypothetical protein
MAPRIGQTNHPDYEDSYERPSARLLATSMSYQYLFANAVKIKPIEKDLFVKIVKAHKSDQLATDLLRRMRAIM